MKPFLSLALACAVAVPATAQTKVYTTCADFDEGVRLNVNCDTPNQLQLDREKQPLPFLYVACSGNGTICRIDINTGQVLAEYRTAPEGLPRSPSRTTVDALGNVWAGNRNEGLAGGPGSVVQVGVVVGGTRVNGLGVPDPNGQYMAPPFLYNTCIDRDGDGLLRTSMAAGEILPWPNVTDGAGGLGGGPALVNDAVDECIRVFQKVDCPSVRHLSVDAENNVWVGGYPNFTTSFQRIHGNDGSIFPGTTFFPACGGFGGLIDGAGTLWSTSFLKGELLRVDGLPGAPNPSCIPLFTSPAGSALDSAGFLWVAGGDRIARVDPSGTVSLNLQVPGTANFLGLAITADDHVWIAAQSQNRVVRLDPFGTVVASVPVGISPTGVAVDGNGKVWVTNLASDNAMRIDPALNAVDLTVDLGSGAQPFNLGDMAGSALLSQVVPMGTWDVVFDSNQLDTRWNQVSWNSFVPADGSLGVQVRASNVAAALPGLPFVPVGNGSPVAGVQGRFVEVQVLFQAQPASVSPILFDLTVSGSLPGGEDDCPTENRRRPSSLLLFPEFDNREGDVTVLSITNVACGPLNDVSVEFRFIDEQDCSEFDRTVHLTGCDTLTLLTSAFNPQQERGFVYAFAVDAPSRRPIVFNNLTGQVLVVSGIDLMEYSMNAVGFRGIGDGVFTDLDGDEILELDGVEYAMAPEKILVPRFFGQSGIFTSRGGMFRSELILIGLSGGARFDTTVDFLIYNDNEEVYSSEYTFRCWERVPLLDISGVFSNSFLQNFTNSNPGEVLGAQHVESGWMQIVGAIAQSNTTVIRDPAIYAVLVERAGGAAAADLPFELCVQPKGKLLPRTLDGGL